MKIIVPTAPGGSIDTAARVVAEKLQAKWGKPVVIENRAGASMRLGAEAVQKSPPDGYTLLVAHDGTMAINPLVFADLPYDPQKDFVPLGLVVSIPEALMVNKAVPANSVAELIALAKKEPGKLTHASGGSATLLSLELFKAMAGVDIRSIPYRGGAPAVTATIGGETSHDHRRPHHRQRRAATPTASARSPSPACNARRNTRTRRRWMKPASRATRSTPGSASSPRPARRRTSPPSSKPRSRRRWRCRTCAPASRSTGAVVRSGSADEMRQVLATDVAKWAKLVHDKGIKLVP